MSFSLRYYKDSESGQPLWFRRWSGAGPARFSGASGKRPDYVSAWPTPTTQDGENDAGPSQFERNSLPLNAAVMVSKSGPAATETQIGGMSAADTISVSPSRDCDSSSSVTPWSSPQQADHKKGSIERTRRSDDLPDEVNEDAEQRGLLNPDWVETLMGFPIGWTRPDGPPLVEPLSMRGSRPESRLSGSGGGSD